MNFLKKKKDKDGEPSANAASVGTNDVVMTPIINSNNSVNTNISSINNNILVKSRGSLDEMAADVLQRQDVEVIGDKVERKITFQSGILKITVVEATSLKGAGESLCLLQHTHIGLTTPPAIGDCPYWDYSVMFDLSSEQSEITIMIVEKSSVDRFCHGMVKILPAWVPEKDFDVWLPLRSMRDQLNGAMIHLKLEYQIGKKKLTPDDFVFMTVLGEGSFGKVMQVRKKDNQQLYAMKVLKKQHLIDREEVDHTLAERKVLEMNKNNAFLVGLKYSFQTDTKLYLLLDYVPGGELFNHLQIEQFFSEERSLFYTAQLVLALEFLHKNDIMYRDLKPENVLLDFTGYLALTDFGLCKMGMKHDTHTWTFCGTPEYMAPEVIKQQGYGRDIDWWSIGILLYEMLSGLPPFYDENVHTMYSKILFQPLTFDNGRIRPNAKDLISRLLERDPTKRLGHGPSGTSDVKSHPFFAKVDWILLLNKRVKPPWRPEISSLEDVAHFDQEFTSRPAYDSVVPDSMLNDEQQAAFNGFTYNEKIL